MNFMRKPVIFFCLFVILAGCKTGTDVLGRGQVDVSKITVPAGHYLDEYDFDKPTDTILWAGQKHGLNAAFVSTDELYLRCEVPQPEDLGDTWEGTGWRGERLNAQVLVWSPDTCQQVRFRVNDLENKDGRPFSKNNIKVNMVRYVLSNFPYEARNTDCAPGTVDSAWLMPDRFEPFERFDLPGRTVRPVWLSFNIPADAMPGVYDGKIGIYSEKGSTELEVKLKVQGMTLPGPEDWKFRLDLWQNPWVIAKYYHVEPWSEEHKMLLRKHLKLYADAGGTFVTTYGVYSPWSDASYTIEGTMIGWTKKKDGSWKFDYSVFDQYVNLAAEEGIDRAITVYTPVPWEYRFRYTDENTGNYVYEAWPPESEQFRKIFNIFLDDLAAHLKDKGWFEKTYLGINENPLDVTLAAARVIRENSPDWKITYAGDWHPELSEVLDDYCTVIKSEPGPSDMKARKSLGFTTTFYICCTPPQPNTFVFSPPVEAAYLGWYAAAYGYDGFLRWAYDAWPADPVRDARHVNWPAGDCFLVYPGANSCIRFERLREGIVDYEKIRVLREMVSGSSDASIKNMMNALDVHLGTLTAERDYYRRVFDVKKMTEDIEKGRRLIENITDALNNR
jgi:hypothetical protein